MGASDLLAAGQAFHEGHFPALIVISGQGYAAAGSAERTEPSLDDDGRGMKMVRRRSFWLPVARFTQAGQPMPTKMERLMVNDVPWTITEVVVDPSSVTVTLNVEEVAQ